LKLKLLGLVVFSFLFNSCTFKPKTKLVVVFVVDHSKTVDIAPTILNFLGVKTCHTFYGKVLPLQ
tara:strand:+ start:147 stop:341 length:195 start_codon:yes stop_codon:yes gene_type:complete